MICHNIKLIYQILQIFLVIFFHISAMLALCLYSEVMTINNCAIVWFLIEILLLDIAV